MRGKKNELANKQHLAKRYITVSSLSPHKFFVFIKFRNKERKKEVRNPIEYSISLSRHQLQMIKEEEEATTEAAKEFQNKPSIKISFVEASTVIVIASCRVFRQFVLIIAHSS